jgi:hypothetical protein
MSTLAGLPPLPSVQSRFYPKTLLQDKQSRTPHDPQNHDRGTSSDSPARAPCPALDFLAALCTHVPDAGQQVIRYYAEWSPVRRVHAQTTCWGKWGRHPMSCFDGQPCGKRCSCRARYRVASPFSQTWKTTGLDWKKGSSEQSRTRS